MSDFLDRLATRGMGSDSMLSPRLPSLFEPAANAGSSAVMEAPIQIPSMQRERAGDEEPLRAYRPVEKSEPADMPVRLPPRSPVHAEAALARSERVVLASPEVLPIGKNEPEGRGAFEAFQPPTIGRLVSRDVETVVRERHIVHEQETVRSVREERLGVLLPPRAPIFATTHEDAARPAASGQRPATMRAAERPQASGEPVVHVSIGRLEVRAMTTTGAATPRRQEGPRPGSMDDYLRQRGGQGS